MPEDKGKTYLPFILGAVVDFALHVCEREHPLIVGADYPNDKLIDEVKAWCDKRNVDLTKGIDRPIWIQACEQGRFKRD